MVQVQNEKPFRPLQIARVLLGDAQEFSRAELFFWLALKGTGGMIVGYALARVL